MNGGTRGGAFLVTLLALFLVTAPWPMPPTLPDGAALPPPHQCPGGLGHPLM